MAEQSAKKEQATASKSKTGEIAIEIASRRNSQTTFGPTMSKLRGRFSIYNLPRGSTSANTDLMQMPEIPGQQVWINPATRTGRIVDPLNREEHKNKIEEMNRVISTFKGEEPRKAVDDRSFPNLTDDQIRTWLYWMRRLVDEKKAVVAAGNLPQLTEIRGKVQKDFWDSSAYAQPYAEVNQ